MCDISKGVKKIKFKNEKDIFVLTSMYYLLIFLLKKKYYFKSGLVIHSCNHVTPEAEAERLHVQGHPKCTMRSCF